MSAIVYGGSGYVAGELLRLLALHPKFEPTLVYSTSQAGELVTSVFPHLAGTKLDSLRFTAEERSFDRNDGEGGLAARRGPLAVFTATPHGAAAPIVKKLFAARAAVFSSSAPAKKNGTSTVASSSVHDRGTARNDFHVVDLSADFRFPDANEWAAIYGKPHAAPELLPQFMCAVPEQVEREIPPAESSRAHDANSNGSRSRNADFAFQHAAQPGCFTTATVCAAWPFFQLGLVEDDVFVSAITGSSGSGRTPAANTHHPDRHATLYAYNALAHRHEPEMARLIGLAKNSREANAANAHTTGAAARPNVEFVPHSGPFVRGIHATVRMTLRKETRAEELVECVNELQRARSRFVLATVAAPKLTEVVGTNRCRLGVATRGRTLVVTSVVDNLTKGAAGGAIQWMNRLFELPDETGLELPGLGWY